jgi:hypothetical protein
MMITQQQTQFIASVIKALMNGIPIEMNDETWKMLDNFDLGIERDKYKSGVFLRKTFLRTEITLSSFIHICLNQSPENQILILAHIALMKINQGE